MDLYNAIFQRKSVRKFDLTPLDDGTLADIQQYIENLQPLISGISYAIGKPESHRRNMIPMKAPHYLSFYSERKDGDLLNIGYLVEKIILYLTTKGIGTCWLGFAKPIADGVEEIDNQQFVIMLAFGKGASEIYRTDVTQFKRKPIAEMTDNPDLYAILEAVRLAPSGLNRQPWYFTGSQEEIYVFRENLGMIKSSMYGKTDQIDLGVALCHLELSAAHSGKRCIFHWHENFSREGYIHVCLAELVDRPTL